MMKEVESAEGLAAEQRAVRTTAQNFQCQRDFLFAMQNKARKEEEEKKAAKAAAAKKEEEEERNLASQIFFMQEREARLKAVNEEFAMKKKEEMTKFIKDTAAGIVKSAIDAILVCAAEYDTVVANVAAQKEKERKKYFGHAGAQGRCKRPHVAFEFRIYLGIVGRRILGLSPKDSLWVRAREQSGEQTAVSRTYVDVRCWAQRWYGGKRGGEHTIR